MSIKEYIKYDMGDKDAWICKCGNKPAENGFSTCDEDGNEMEPDANSNWNNLYVCFECGRIINQATREIVGQNRNFKRLP